MMKKNDSEHAAFQVNHKEILDDDLQQVSGGWCSYDDKSYYEICPFCKKVINQTLGEHEYACTTKPWWDYSRG